MNFLLDPRLKVLKISSLDGKKDSAAYASRYHDSWDINFDNFLILFCPILDIAKTDDFWQKWLNWPSTRQRGYPT